MSVVGLEGVDTLGVGVEVFCDVVEGQFLGQLGAEVQEDDVTCPVRYELMTAISSAWRAVAARTRFSHPAGSPRPRTAASTAPAGTQKNSPFGLPFLSKRPAVRTPITWP